MTGYYCAICRRTVSMDQRHVEIEAETVAEDAPELESYLAHTDCWRSVSEGWMQPA